MPEVKVKRRRLRRPDDIRRFLANIACRVEAGQLDPQVGGRLAYIANVLLKSIELEKLSELEGRLDVLEGLEP